jgi:[ribosomal protein S18]-alanine N-acetyltransferase
VNVADPFDVRVRDARSTDVEMILRIAESGNLGRWSAADYQREAERLDSIFLVASADSAPVGGFVVGRILPGSEEGSRIAELYNIGVAGELRRLGIGSILLDRFIKSARQQGVSKVTLEVRAGNEPAIAFYEKLGFNCEFVRKSFYCAPTDDANVMSANV